MHGLLLAYEVAPKAEYLDAAARNLRPIVQLCARTAGPRRGSTRGRKRRRSTPTSGSSATGWPTDRDALRDYEEGRITFGQSPDNAVYFQVVLRDYLAHRDEASLFETDDMLKKINRLPTTLP